MSEPLKLLNEDCISEQKTITENVGNSQHMYITGPFLQAVTRNRNGRVYPQHIIEREVGKFQSLIESREAVGELSHPDSGEINPDRAAILITDLHMDGNLGKDNVVCEDFSLLTIDAVYMPSAQVAYSDAIYESIQSTVKWVLDEKSGLLIEKKEDINKAAEKFNKTVDKEGSKAIVDAFKEFLSRL